VLRGCAAVDRQTGGAALALSVTLRRPRGGSIAVYLHPPLYDGLLDTLLKGSRPMREALLVRERGEPRREDDVESRWC
jgi:hypothetical protein